MDVIIGSNKRVGTDSQHFYLEQTGVLNILGATPRTIAFEPKQTAGRKLLVSLAEPVALDTAVRIDRDDACLLGEVTRCWEDTPGTILAVVEFSQYHPRTSKVTSLAMVSSA